MKRFSLLALLLMVVGSRLMADVVEPGEIQRSFKVINLNQFPDYNFYILYTGYHYHEGYQPNAPFKIWLVQDSTYYTSSRDDNSLVYAVSKKDSTEEWASDRHVGGGDIVSSERISTITDVVKITKVADQKVHFVIVKEIVVYDDGSTRERKPHAPKLDFLPVAGDDGGSSGWLYWLLPSVSVLILAVFFFWRRKQKQTTADARIAV